MQIFGEQNKIIRKLFDELDDFSTNHFLKNPNYEDQYWEIKLRLFQQISKKYGDEYSPEIAGINVPCVLISMIVEMERENMQLRSELE